jgi:hypothetical protein
MKLLSNQGRGGEFVFDMLQLFLLAALLLLACSKQQLSLSHSSYSSSRFQFFCFSLLAAPLHPDPVLYFKATSVAAAGDIYCQLFLLAALLLLACSSFLSLSLSSFRFQCFSAQLHSRSCAINIIYPLYLLRLLASLFFSQLFSMSVLLHSI